MITAKVRIVAQSQRQAETIAAYLTRVSDGHITFRPPDRGRGSNEWLVYGRVELTPADVKKEPST